ncbi:MAG: class III extradiol ring-cleavage dioxygenase [Brevefilum sp.]|nr:class III extradiol ring-cleavage dioxygenase [Brevefilum sp.]
MNPENKTQIVYFSHGGGPLPLLGDPGHQAMIEFMTQLPTQLPKPEAILVISAHWEEPVVTLLGAAHPPMFYDYYGFPEAAYQITYPARGHPALGARIVTVLEQAGIPARLDHQRGFDHGLFIPLSLMYPGADIPALQISLLQGLSPVDHLALGNALRSLQNENLLVIGSGFSFHNMSAFFHHDPHMITPRNAAFQDWLIDTITTDITQSEREARLAAWENAPYARYCHPREEHLLPLHVCAALAGQAGEVIFDDNIMGVRCLAFTW